MGLAHLLNDKVFSLTMTSLKRPLDSALIRQSPLVRHDRSPAVSCPASPTSVSLASKRGVSQRVPEPQKPQRFNSSFFPSPSPVVMFRRSGQNLALLKVRKRDSS